jgi:threonine/homoserine/homoserine lactone efflux protein
MTAVGLAALFLTLAALAAVPSVSVLTVTSRAIERGPLHGALTALGIVAGDVFYILLALLGGAAVFTAGGPWSDGLRVVGALLLALFAWRQWRFAGHEMPAASHAAAGASFALGLAVTLGDAKAVIFYLVLLPAFVEVGELGARGVMVILAVAVISVGSVKLGYALAAVRVAAWVGSGRAHTLQRFAALALAAAALLLLAGVGRP